MRTEPKESVFAPFEEVVGSKLDDIVPLAMGIFGNGASFLEMVAPRIERTRAGSSYMMSFINMTVGLLTLTTFCDGVLA
jgi:hypothetical protein